MATETSASEVSEVLTDVEQRCREPQPDDSPRDDTELTSGRSPSSPRIMIVDDEPLVTDTLKEFLRGGGYDQVIAANDPVDAYSMIQDEQPDLLLLDHHMAPVNGLKLLREIRAEERFARLPVIMLTAETDHALKLKALELGATDFLNKPMNHAELLARLRNILRAKAHEDRLQQVERQRRTAAERELQAADSIQAKLYPASAPQSAGPLDMAGATFSAGRGCGDYFDFLRMPDGHVALVVGDVSGHGMPAALRMVEARAYLRSLAKHQTDAGRILSELNQFMIREAAYGFEGGEQFVTLFLGVIDSAARELVYASAGHVGYLIRDGKSSLKLDSTGLPLGIADMPIDVSDPIALAPGDVLLVTTDGVQEAMTHSGWQFGTLRMLSAVRSCRSRSAQGIVEQLYSAVRQFTDGTFQQDDITVTVAKVGEETAR